MRDSETDSPVEIQEADAARYTKLIEDTEQRVRDNRFLCLGCSEGQHHLCNPAEHCECGHKGVDHETT